MKLLPPLYKVLDVAEVFHDFFPWASLACPPCGSRLTRDQQLALQANKRVRCAECGQRITWKSCSLWENTHATPAQAAAFLYALSFGLTLEQQAEAAGISVDTARNWGERVRVLGG